MLNYPNPPPERVKTHRICIANKKLTEVLNEVPPEIDHSRLYFDTEIERGYYDSVSANVFLCWDEELRSVAKQKKLNDAYQKRIKIYQEAIDEGEKVAREIYDKALKRKSKK